MLKKRANVGKLSGQLFADTVHIFQTADLVFVIERHLYGCGVLSLIRGVQGGNIVDHTDIRQHHFQIPWLDHSVDHALDPGYIIVGNFDSRSRGSLKINRELARIGLREKRPAHKGKDSQACNED